jgi:hypothetical protein
MSEVRAHFCTDVARRCSGTLWPRKYGLNWFMPAIAVVPAVVRADGRGTTTAVTGAVSAERRQSRAG